jgi:hypothetical protein
MATPVDCQEGTLPRWKVVGVWICSPPQIIRCAGPSPPPMYAKEISKAAEEGGHVDWGQLKYAYQHVLTENA